MGGLLLRRALGADVRALARLEAECFTHPWTEGQLRDEVEGGPPGAVLVLEGPRRRGGLVDGLGAYCCYRLVADEMHVMNVAVLPALRRRGIGRWLVGFAMRRARAAGASRALLEVRSGNRKARRLYERLGFAPIGVRRDYYREPVEDAVVLLCEGLRPRETGEAPDS
jgi:[ribosomal protein S18]-alanine N-acetyltransferase